MTRLAFMFALLTALASGAADETSPNQWEDEIAALEAKWKVKPVEPGGILFVGSSSIRLWKLDESFPDLPTVNHGFGGSQMSDSVHFFDRIVKPVQPSIIVVYAGDNDIADGKSPETVARDFTSFVDRVHTQLPDCRKVVYIAIKPSIKRWALADTGRAANGRIRELCERTPDRLQFLDIWTPMLDANGQPRPDLLVDDGLHMNAAGYKIWSDALRPHLAESASLKASEQ